MKRIALMILAALVVSIAIVATPRIPTEPLEDVVGCAATSPASQLIAPSEKLGLCVLQAGVSDLIDAINDPASLVPAVVSACLQYGEATAAQIVTVIEEYFASPPAVDSGLALSSVQTARLTRLHDAALALGSRKR
jgi:hypothetical protein